MEKGLIISSVIIVLLVVAGIGYYVWDNSESVIRDRIQKSWYEEMSYEYCELNNYAGFPSKPSCFSALNCASEKVAELIRVSDLKQFNKDIKAKTSIETRVGSLVEFDTLMKTCFIPNGFNENLR